MNQMYINTCQAPVFPQFQQSLQAQGQNQERFLPLLGGFALGGLVGAEFGHHNNYGGYPYYGVPYGGYYAPYPYYYGYY